MAQQDRPKQRLLLFIEAEGLDPTKVRPKVLHKDSTGRPTATRLELLWSSQNGDEPVLDGDNKPIIVEANDPAWKGGTWISDVDWNIDIFKQAGYNGLVVKAADNLRWREGFEKIQEPRNGNTPPQQNQQSTAGTSGQGPLVTIPGSPTSISDIVVSEKPDKPGTYAVSFFVLDGRRKPCAAEVTITFQGTSKSHTLDAGAHSEEVTVPSGKMSDYIVLVAGLTSKKVPLKGEVIQSPPSPPAPPVAHTVRVIDHHLTSPGTYTVVGELLTEDGKKLVPSGAFRVLVQGQPPRTERADADGNICITVTLTNPGQFNVKLHVSGQPAGDGLTLDGPPLVAPAPPPAPPAVCTHLREHHPAYPAKVGRKKHFPWSVDALSEGKPLAGKAIRCTATGPVTVMDGTTVICKDELSFELNPPGGKGNYTLVIGGSLPQVTVYMETDGVQLSTVFVA